MFYGWYYSNVIPSTMCGCVEYCPIWGMTVLFITCSYVYEKYYVVFGRNEQHPHNVWAHRIWTTLVLYTSMRTHTNTPTHTHTHTHTLYTIYLSSSGPLDNALQSICQKCTFIILRCTYRFSDSFYSNESPVLWITYIKVTSYCPYTYTCFTQHLTPTTHCVDVC